MMNDDDDDDDDDDDVDDENDDDGDDDDDMFFISHYCFSFSIISNNIEMKMIPIIMGSLLW